MKSQLVLMYLLVAIGYAAGQAPPAPPPAYTGPAPGAEATPPPSNYPPGPVEMIAPPTRVGTPPPLAPSPPPYDEPLAPPAPIPWTVPKMAGPQYGWLETDFLLWWTRSMPNPTPLATNGSLADFSPGAFGQPGTTAVLLGGQNVNFNPAGGFRIAGGDWFGCEQRWGLEASFFILAEQTVHQGVASDENGNPGIYRPVNDVNLGESSLYVALPNMAAGFMSVSTSSQLLGVEFNGLYRFVQAPSWNLNIVGGFRFLDLNEHINIRTVTDDFAGVLTGPNNQFEVPGSTLTIFDGFHTSNQFYGGQVGLQTTASFGSGWYITGRAILGLGDTVQNISISGNTVQFQPGIGVTTAPAGGLTTAANIGHFTHDAFSVVPEAQLKIGYQLGRFVNLFAGYNFLYWSNVVRPGTAISRNVDFQGIPTSNLYNLAVPPAAPSPPSFVNTGYWAQGLNLGVLFTF